jgi:hypothetical protein
MTKGLIPDQILRAYNVLGYTPDKMHELEMEVQEQDLIRWARKGEPPQRVFDAVPPSRLFAPDKKKSWWRTSIWSGLLLKI